MTRDENFDLDAMNCGALHIERDHTIGHANSIIGAWLDVDPAQLVGKTLDTLFAPGTLLYWESTVLPMVYSKGYAWDVALDLRRSGQTFSVVGNLVRRDEGIDAVLLRFDERRRYERALAQADAERAQRQREIDGLETLSRLRLDFINSAAHELATPLTPIELQLDMLKRGVASSDRQALKAIEIITRNVRHIERFARDLQAAAKVDGGRLSPSPDEVDVAAAVRDLVPDMAADLRYSLSARGHVRARTSMSVVASCLKKLLDNVRKFGAGKPVEIKVLENPPRIVVRDHGQGISAKDLPRVGRPFVQVHDRAEVTALGTGLGLYIARAYMEANGGSLTVVSAGDDLGTTVTLTFQAPQNDWEQTPSSASSMADAPA